MIFVYIFGLLTIYLISFDRSDLTKKAEKESIAVFCSNVRSLLLTPPVRGKTVIGIDPGFSHGCKIAVVSSKGIFILLFFLNALIVFFFFFS